jgi:hypothetical protein
MVGVGGILAEAVADVAIRPVPITEVDAAEMIDELSIQALLGEFRGEPAVDRDAVARCAARPLRPQEPEDRTRASCRST